MLDWLAVLDEPWVFSQRLLLNADQFKTELERRASTHLLSPRQLEPLDRCGFLKPAFRWNPRAQYIIPSNNGAELLQARANGDLRDGTEHFFPWLDGEVEFAHAVYYSPWQLIDSRRITELIGRLIPVRRRKDTLPDRWAYPSRTDRVAPMLVNPRLAQLLTALEPMYLPDVQRSLAAPPAMGPFEDWEDARTRFSPVDLLQRSGWTMVELENASRILIVRADGANPLGDWYRIVGLTPERWQELRFDGLVSLEMRIAAELLFRFRDDLRASGVPAAQTGVATLDERRLPRLSADPSELLLKFGLSAHPRILVVIEGDTEQRLAPRIAALLGIPFDPPDVRVFNRGGDSAHLATLVRLMVAPQVASPLPGTDWIGIRRPLTKLLYLTDPEAASGSPEQRTDQQRTWVDLIVKELARQGARVAHATLERLVELYAWDKGTFEFAHFTDAELATAIRHVHRGDPQDLADLEGQLERTRASDPRLEFMWHAWSSRPSKVVLAEELWPILSHRIERAAEDGTLSTIPIVAGLLKIPQWLGELPPSGTVVLVTE